MVKNACLSKTEKTGAAFTISTFYDVKIPIII